MPRLARRAVLAVSAFAGPAFASDPAADLPVVAAASDLLFALEEISRRFEAEGFGRVRLSFGSSSNLARQIEQGAPFQMFLSADESFVFRLAERGLTRDRGALYAIGRIVIFVPPHSDLEPDGTLADLAAAIADNRLRRFAIANPEHAPYGMAAMQALRSRGLWQGVQRALVLGETVSQAAQFAATGNSQGGIIARSLALAPALRSRGRFGVIPEEFHEPLRQRMVLLRNAGPTAERFYAFLQQYAARETMARFGFGLPDV